MKRPGPPPAEATVRVPVGRFEPEAPAGAGVEGLSAVTGWVGELTRELLEELVEVAKLGGFKRQCALACGVRPELLEWWLTEGMREDAEPMQQELSARFQSAQQRATLGHVQTAQRASRNGEWEAAITLLKLRDPLWRGSEKFLEPETAPPAASLADRMKMLKEELREARLNPIGPLADALREAGFPLETPESSESDGPLALLARGIPGSQSDE